MAEFEIKILDFIRETFSSTFLDKVMPAITFLGDRGIFWIALSLILLIFRKTRPLGFSMIISLAIGYACGNIVIKNIVARARPYEHNNEIALLISQPRDFSFPSGHTLASFEGATCIFIRYKKLGVIALIFALLIAFSRLYLYVHFPSDILAGMVLGIIFAIIGSKIANRIYRNKNTLSNKNIID